MFFARCLQALRQVRSSYNTRFTTPGYNCYLTPAGKSSVEPKVDNTSDPRYMRGVTDTPNRGPRTVGYSPARGVVLCWEEYEEAARQAANSRIYGGIHIRVDNDDGLKLGKRIGESVTAFMNTLSPVNFRAKGEDGTVVLVWKACATRAARWFGALQGITPHGVSLACSQPLLQLDGGNATQQLALWHEYCCHY